MLKELVGLEDRELVQRAQNGESGAFDLLVERHQGHAFAVAVRMLPSREDALDVCQDAFLKAFRGLPGFNLDSAFSTWLHRIVLNACASFHRKRGAAKRGTAISIHATGDDSESRGMEIAGDDRRPDESAVGAEVRLQVAEAISTLDEEYREVIVLRDLEGLSYQEIAEALEVPAGTVRSRLHRGRKELAGRLRHLAPEGAGEGRP